MSKNILKTEQPTTNPLEAAPAKDDRNLKCNILDLLSTLDRRSQLAGLRSIAGSIQFTLINTADWIVRREDGAVASANPTLDERNAFDEFARTQAGVDEAAHELGFETLQTPEEKLKQYAHLYFHVVDSIKTLNPQPFERPKSLLTTLDEFVPRGAALDDNTMKLLEAAESEPGEFQKAREEGKAKKTADLLTRKPRIKQLLELNADCMPLDVIDELPRHVQLRLITAAWKGIYFSRKQLVTFIGTYNRLDDLAAVVAMAKDLEIVATHAENFEHANSQLFEIMIEAGVNVYGIADAKADVKKPRN